MSEVTVAATPVAPAAPSAPAAQATTAPNTAPAEGVTAQNPADQAAAAQPDEKTETPDQAEKRGKSRFERRIARFYREAAELRAENGLLKRQNEELKPKPAEDAAAPRLEQFKDIEEYAAAKAKYAENKALRDHTAKQQEESQRQAQAKMVETWRDRVESASDKYEDWDEVVGGELNLQSPCVSAIMEAENGPDIAYYLGKNLKEAQRIALLPPLAQIRAIGRLEEKLAAAPPQEKTPSKAPAPVKPLTGATPAEAPNMQDTADIGKWIKNRSKQVHGARR